MGFFGDLKQDLSQAVNELLPDDSQKAEPVSTEPEETPSQSEFSLGDMLENIDSITLPDEGSGTGEDIFNADSKEQELFKTSDGGSLDLESMLNEISEKEEAKETGAFGDISMPVDNIFASQPEASGLSATDEEALLKELFDGNAGQPEEDIFGAGAETPSDSELKDLASEAAAIGESFFAEAFADKGAETESFADSGTVISEAESFVDAEPVEEPAESFAETAGIDVTEDFAGEALSTGESFVDARSVEEPAESFAETTGIDVTEDFAGEALSTEESFVDAEPVEKPAESFAETTGIDVTEGFAGIALSTEESFADAQIQPPAEEFVADAMASEPEIADMTAEEIQTTGDNAYNEPNEEASNENIGGDFSMDSFAENRVAADETSVITAGMTITGDIESEGSIDIVGNVNGNIHLLGKLNVTGHVNGNSKAAEIFAEGAKINGEVISEGAVKVGASTIIIGNISATSAAIAGAVKGDIDVKGPVVLDASAIVMGNIKSKSVQINNGAVVEGMCSQCYADVSPSAFFDEYKPEPKKQKASK